MNTSQIQVKLSLSSQLNNLLKAKAANMGIPVTQFVKHLIIDDLEKDYYPTRRASPQTEKAAEKALKKIPKAKKVKNIADYFKSL